jgi:hypothetical protein
VSKKCRKAFNLEKTIDSLFKKNPFKFFLGAGLAFGVNALLAKEASAAGFLDHVLANFANNKSIPDSWRDLIRMIGAVSYLIPVIAFLGSIVAYVMASNHSDGALTKTKMGILILWLGIAVIWIYDATSVGKV